MEQTASPVHDRRSTPTGQAIPQEVTAHPIQPAGSHTNRNRTIGRSPPISYVLTSFQDGTELGDGLRLLVSPDGLKWSELPGAPLILPRAKAAKSRVFRDPSMVYHGGHFHLVFTSDLCVDQVPATAVRRHVPRPVLWVRALARSSNGR